MSDARIHEFYQSSRTMASRHLLPEWLPSPDSSLRDLYLGENDPEMMLKNAFRFSVYADQII